MRGQIIRTVETFEGEYLKAAAELGLHMMAEHWLGQHALELVRGGMRVEDNRLHSEVAGLHFENPLMVGSGWDKKGRAVDGLHALGFAGTEVGSVLVHPQPGNPQPRLWTDKQTKSVGWNRLGFNSPGKEVVAHNLEGQRRNGIIGISLGKNKLTPDEYAPWEHAAVAERLRDVADYFVINVASPNTPGLRNLLKRDPLTNIIRAVGEVAGSKPVFVKTTVDLAIEDLDVVLDVLVNEKVTGVIDSNTTIEDAIKQKYGWQGEMGGVSGNDPDYRKKCTERMKHITRDTHGTGLQRIGVGAINDTESALERIQAGAQVVQLVTAIRQYKGRVARNINLGLLGAMERDGVQKISDYVGTAV